MDADMREI